MKIFFDTERKKTCDVIYFTDTTCQSDESDCEDGYGVDTNPEQDEITETIIRLTDSAGVVFEYDGYLPTDGEIELKPTMFTDESGDSTVITETVDSGCGCTTITYSATGITTTVVFRDGCWTITYEIYVDGELIATKSKQIFFVCNSYVRWNNNMRANLCGGDCQSKIQEALHEVRDLIRDAEWAQINAGCSCAEALLEKANELLEDIENDAI